MDEKGIALWELSCRTAAELPALELPASAAVQLPEYTAGLLRRRPDCRRSFGGSLTYYENSPFPVILGVVLGLWCSHAYKLWKKSVHDL